MQNKKILYNNAYNISSLRYKFKKNNVIKTTTKGIDVHLFQL